MKTVLFLNHKEKQCGVYQYGKRTADIITKSLDYNIVYAEIDSGAEYSQHVGCFSPSAVIYNYYPSTMPWLTHSVLDSGRGRFAQFAIFHEVPLTYFDYYIHTDPTRLEDNTNFSVGRPLLDYEVTYSTNPIPVIGSFGFGFGNKGYDDLVRLINTEFDEAVINLHIPFAKYGDEQGISANSLAKMCREVSLKPGVQLNITHDFLTTEKLLEFLASNTLNAFPYHCYDSYGRGPASTIDYALSVKRPIAITKSYQFRHLVDVEPSIYIEEVGLRTIIENGIEPLKKFYKLWSASNLIKDYERILGHVLG